MPNRTERYLTRAVALLEEALDIGIGDSVLFMKIDDFLARVENNEELDEQL